MICVSFFCPLVYLHVNQLGNIHSFRQLLSCGNYFLAGRGERECFGR